MAKQWGSYMGGFSGRLGPAVGYMWNGKWCLRSLPSQVRNPRTPRQMENRDAFRQQVQLAAAMRGAVLCGMTREARQMGMTAYNLFVSLNQPCFSLADRQLVVDWARLQLSTGPVAPVRLENAVVSADGVLTVAFDPCRGERRAKGYDQVWLYVYCPELGEGCTAAPVYRRDKRVSFLLPDAFVGSELQVYAYVQDELGEGSATAHTCLAAEGSATEVAENPQASLTERRPVGGVDTPEGAGMMMEATAPPGPQPRVPTPTRWEKIS